MTNDEAIEIIECGDIYNRWGKDGREVEKMAIKALKQEPKTDWIPVFERMPKDGQNVLFCDIDEDIMIGYHVKGEPDTHFMQDGSFEGMKNVKAWMPLPEPYKIERGE